MKAKVTNVTYRKDSETFPEWMKYEITLLWENGTTEKIPAYGRDLQDALSRVDHDLKIKRVYKKVEKVPVNIWILGWFLYLGILILLWQATENHWIVAGGLAASLLAIVRLSVWARERNRL
jgi:hypothetical protein